MCVVAELSWGSYSNEIDHYPISPEHYFQLQFTSAYTEALTNTTINLLANFSESADEGFIIYNQQYMI